MNKQKNQRKGFKSKKINALPAQVEIDEIDLLLAKQKGLYEEMAVKLPDAIKTLEANLQKDGAKLQMMKMMLTQYNNTQFDVEQKQVKDMHKAVTFNPKRLRELRVGKGWSQSAFARKIDYSPSTVSNAECGNYVPGPEFIEKSAKVLEVTKDQLLN